MSTENADGIDPLEFEGLVQGSADDKGRIKIPTLIKKHLEKDDDSSFFVTTFDRRIVRIYSREAWKRNRAILDGAATKAAASVLFLAKVYGSAASLDKQGRILLSPALRKDLGIGAEPVWFEQSKDHVKVFGKKIYDERLAAATEDIETKVEEVENQLGVR